MKKDFEVTEVINGITGYRELTGGNLNFFNEGAEVTDVETVGVELRYYVSYKGRAVLLDVNKEGVEDFFKSGDYTKFVDN